MQGGIRQIISPFVNNFTIIRPHLHIGTVTQFRYKSKIYVPRPRPFKTVKYEAMAQSLKSKGYLRSQNSYNPPENVQSVVDELKTSCNLKSGCNAIHFSQADKFIFLSFCAEKFQHTVPNSVLHEINTTDDVVKFYETAIKTFLPLDELRTMELPPNLHIEHNYTRFHPDTDTMFGGKSAFPEQSCIVTGITSRKKYSGFVAERRREEIHEDFKPK